MLLFNQFKMNLLQDSPPAGGAPPPAAGTPPPAADSDWSKLMGSLPDDLKSDASLTPIKDFQGLVKSYVSAQKMVGGKVNLPDPKHATEADYIAVLKKMGVPEKIEEYNFKLPDGVKAEELNQDFMGKLKAAAHANGVLPWQFEKLYGAYHDQIKDMNAAEDAKWQKEVTEGTEALKKDWGPAFDTQVKKANVAFKELVPNEADRTKLVQDGLGGHPVVMKILANAAKYFKEDVFLGHGAGEFSGVTPETALQRAREIQGNKDHPYRNPVHPNHAAAKKEVQDLYRIAFPE
jgi:hypothetical protein